MSEQESEKGYEDRGETTTENIPEAEIGQTQTSYVKAAGLGALTSIPVLALGYLAETIAGLPLTAYDLFDGLARILPGDV